MNQFFSESPIGFKPLTGDSPDDQQRDPRQLRRKSERLLRGPASDSNLTAAQRTARELYQFPTSDSKRSSVFESGDATSILSANSHAAVKDWLSNNSRGLQDFSKYEINRGFTGGGDRYMLGAEFAIVAIIAMAGIAKRRTDLSYSESWVLSDEEKRTKPRAEEVIYQSPRFKHQTLEFNHGLNKEVPDWLISLDTSAAKEEGYLFGSVLTRPTVIITMSDSFASIAEMHFRDAVLAWLIVDLNGSKVTETWKGSTKIVAIKNGETIELPVWEDIVEFYQSKPKTAKSDNLLTVVLKRNVDREMIEEALASVIVPGTPGRNN